MKKRSTLNGSPSIDPTLGIFQLKEANRVVPALAFRGPVDTHHVGVEVLQEPIHGSLPSFLSGWLLSLLRNLQLVMLPD